MIEINLLPGDGKKKRRATATGDEVRIQPQAPAVARRD